MSDWTFVVGEWSFPVFIALNSVLLVLYSVQIFMGSKAPEYGIVEWPEWCCECCDSAHRRRRRDLASASDEYAMIMRELGTYPLAGTQRPRSARRTPARAVPPVQIVQIVTVGNPIPALSLPPYPPPPRPIPSVAVERAAESTNAVAAGAVSDGKYDVPPPSLRPPSAHAQLSSNSLQPPSSDEKAVPANDRSIEFAAFASPAAAPPSLPAVDDPELEADAGADAVADADANAAVEYSQLPLLNPTALIEPNFEFDPPPAQLPLRYEPTPASGPHARQLPIWLVRVERHSLAWWLHRIGWALALIGILCQLDFVREMGYSFFILAFTELYRIGIQLILSVWYGKHLLLPWLSQRPSVWPFANRLRFTISALYRRMGRVMPISLRRFVLSITPCYVLASCVVLYPAAHSRKWTLAAKSIALLSTFVFVGLSIWAYVRTRTVVREANYQRAAMHRIQLPAVRYLEDRMRVSMDGLRRFVVVVTVVGTCYMWLLAMKIWSTVDWLRPVNADDSILAPGKRDFAEVIIVAASHVIPMFTLHACWIPISPLRTPPAVAAASA